ncbi:ceramide synthase 1-like isoform X3 [Alosa alosa]|uniref:ceramide synthase 1-like isoform X3 n=1 Tax=Alosa alosa TaxID=278164 RepID=UPI0020150A3B|nr:ceramide synthase 1-like isoform X3 [Alosa alosa]
MLTLPGGRWALSVYARYYGRFQGVNLPHVFYSQLPSGVTSNPKMLSRCQRVLGSSFSTQPPGHTVPICSSSPNTLSFRIPVLYFMTELGKNEERTCPLRSEFAKDICCLYFVIDWTSGMPIPIDITIAYLIQGSFYGHSIYASFYMDVWRRDSVIMVIHHVVTLVLITFSYAFRYHKIGVLVLFLHDINDIQLEFTKLNVYLRNSGWVYKSINEIISTVGCISFSFTWFWFRLYWFPLKVLYASCIASLESVPNIPFYFLFNSLLFTLLLMNLYWFLYIMLFMVKVLTGQMKEIKDVREYEDEEHEKAKLLNIAENDTDHPDLRQEEGHEKNGIPKEKSL